MTRVRIILKAAWKKHVIFKNSTSLVKNPVLVLVSKNGQNRGSIVKVEAQKYKKYTSWLV